MGSLKISDERIAGVGRSRAYMEAEVEAEVEDGCGRAPLTGWASWKLRTRQRKWRRERSGHSTWQKVG